jgi:hypothetical protein
MALLIGPIRSFALIKQCPVPFLLIGLMIRIDVRHSGRVSHLPLWQADMCPQTSILTEGMRDLDERAHHSVLGIGSVRFGQIKEIGGNSEKAREIRKKI